MSKENISEYGFGIILTLKKVCFEQKSTLLRLGEWKALSLHDDSKCYAVALKFWLMSSH